MGNVGKLGRFTATLTAGRLLTEAEKGQNALVGEKAPVQWGWMAGDGLRPRVIWEIPDEERVSCPSRIVLSCALIICAASGDLLGLVTEVRSIDGSGNNLANSWGAADTSLLRIAPAAYPDDGSGATILQAPSRSNPREISNAIADQGGLSILNQNQFTDLFWQWGQFLDHDIDLTGNAPENGTAPIEITASGDLLSPGPIPFDRSDFLSGTGTGTSNPRQQVNQITSFIDASNVYGADPVRAAELRSFTGGRLKISTGNLLPMNTAGLPNAGGTGSNLFLAGDIRANEQVGLLAMQTLLVREHNRLADLLATQIPGALDEELYQTVRKIVGAEMQIITYNDFLPMLLGSLAPEAAAFSYDSSVNPSIANSFSTAFYRFGHTMIASELLLVGDDGVVRGSIPLRDAFFNPDFVKENPENVGLLLMGMASHMAQEIDTKLVDDVRNFLFGPPGAGGVDLASLNIQRGRDHGLPDYNTMRQAFDLSPVSDFSEITSDILLQQILEVQYGNVDNIDAWVGGLAEDHVPGTGVGELIAATLIDQFTRLRDGDRFFYRNDPDLLHPDVLAVIDMERVTLAKIIGLNTAMANMPDNVFFVPEPSALALVSLSVFCSIRSASGGRRTVGL